MRGERAAIAGRRSPFSSIWACDNGKVSSNQDLKMSATSPPTVIGAIFFKILWPRPLIQFCDRVEVDK